MVAFNLSRNLNTSSKSRNDNAARRAATMRQEQMTYTDLGDYRLDSPPPLRHPDVALTLPGYKDQSGAVDLSKTAFPIKDRRGTRLVTPPLSDGDRRLVDRPTHGAVPVLQGMWGLFRQKGGTTNDRRHAPKIRKITCDNGFVYEDVPYHGKVGTDTKSRAPTDPKTAMENSVTVKPTSKMRISYDRQTREIIIFRYTEDNTFHGHVSTWNELKPEMKSVLIKEFNFTPKGKSPKI